MYKYKYCANCGELFNKKSETLYVCPKCDFRIFVSPKPACAVFLFNKNGEILFLKRSFDPGKGLWGIPGGFVDPNETLEEALTREVFEETNQKVNEFKYFGSFSGDYLYKNILYKVITTIYTGSVQNSKISISNESSEYRFFKLEEMNPEEIGNNDDRKAFNELVQSKHH